MKNTSKWVCFLMTVTGLFAAGCGSSRDVEVSGEVSAPATTTVQGEILLDFSEVLEDEETKSVHTATLAALGPFKETVELEGDSVRVRAINDRDGDGVCSEGEAWAEVDAAISDDDKVQELSLELTNAPCPTAE